MNYSFSITGWNYGNNKLIIFGRLFSVLILVVSCIAYMAFGVNGLLLASYLYISLLAAFIILMLIELNKNRLPANTNDEWPETTPITEQAH